MAWPWAHFKVQSLPVYLWYKLETSIIPTLGKSLLKWKRYVDNTFYYVKIGTVNHILNKLNGFRQNIQLTYEFEKNNKLAFLDVLLILI